MLPLKEKEETGKRGKVGKEERKEEKKKGKKDKRRGKERKEQGRKRKWMKRREERKKEARTESQVSEEAGADGHSTEDVRSRGWIPCGSALY